MRLLLVLSGVLLSLRIFAATKVGFGDSEALYASWAVHPQPAYLDHPGLVGLVARAIGEGGVPTPFRAHVVSSILATLLPWFIVVVARAIGAEKDHAFTAGIIVALVPEIAIGLFALTPDLLLAPLWLGALGLAIVGLGGGEFDASPNTAAKAEDDDDAEDDEETPHKGTKNASRRARAGGRRQPAHANERSARGLHRSAAERRAGEHGPSLAAIPSNREAGALLGAGLLAGVSASAKVSGLLLMVSLAIAYVQLARSKGENATDNVQRAARAARSLWPWAGLVAGVIVIVPIALFEARLGFPMLHHRLVATQIDNVGVAQRGLINLGALLGGQLAYLSPVIAFVAVVVARDLVLRRNDDVASRVLFWSFAVPFLPLLLLCLWSPVAEPHWIAPPLLALPLHAARRASDAVFFLKRTLLRVGVAIAAAITAAAHAWVLVPESAQLMPTGVDPKLDITSELYGWPAAIEAVKEQMAQASTPFDVEGREVVVVGPHWTICAQLHAALPGVRVGCTTAIPDDFDRWLPRETWRRADNVLFVTDNRFPGDGAEQLPAHVRVSQSRVRVLRGGRTSRVFDLYLYSRRQSAQAASNTD